MRYAAPFFIAAILSGCGAPENSPEAVATPPQAASVSPSETDSDVDASPEIDRLTNAYYACMTSGDAAQGLTMAMALCTSQEIDRQDTALNAAYQRLITQRAEFDDEFGASTEELLREAQRAWVTWRDANCLSKAQTGGSMDRLIYPGCMLDMTVHRTLELEEMAELY